MPVRATKRGAERTRLDRDCDVLVCGASFAGLAVARELAGSGARVLVVDRYEVGERQTSACAMPTVWLSALDLMSTHRQTFDELIVHTRFRTSRWQLPWSFSTFDYRELCAAMYERADDGALEFETATVTGREGTTVHTDRGVLRAPLVVDGLGWRRVLSNAPAIQPPNARLSRGLEVHPPGTGSEMELWIDARYVRAGYGWSFPARDELRVGAGSFWPAHHVKEPTVRLAGELGLPAQGYQGNWIPHQLRRATEDGVFFAGDSAGHCLPVTAEGIRTALYFGLACGRELRAVVEGTRTRAQAAARYAAFSDSHKRKFAMLLGFQRAVGQLTPTRALDAAVRAFESRRLTRWAFDHYLAIAPASFVSAGPPAASSSASAKRRMPSSMAGSARLA
ncbi:MAG TPA: FAD-binding protein [Solirubrobacteraceae bacterium]|jgi:flavin-dependent dehydrogenase|nr:FAD-binding protein [Solirubrobacteraceae bacterium]